ncbi:hypothetical protein [Streptomyces sp. NPDC051286]|uniref:hypothetical protein n=1 Tax=Streptomyces sp. NPDC051286 TaxID=3365647 RepID=UPI0037958833
MINRSRVPAADLAADPDAWLRLLALHCRDKLSDAEPATMRFRIYHLPGRLAVRARRRNRRLDPSWPWSKTFILAWWRLTDLTAGT